MKIYKKAILPNGFKASGVACGIKKSQKLDLALFYSGLPAKAAAKFTSNKIKAAHIKIDKQYLKHNRIFQGIVVNSGNANCFTGRLGIRDTLDTSRAAAKALHLNSNKVLVASTGIIGKRLPVNKIKKAIPELVRKLSGNGINKAKLAIMTTDTFSKEITVKFNIANKQITICGVAKGAGMIAPHMATMLCFIFTDANIAQAALNKALDISTDKSFNCITVDGCMSTNDSIIILANGACGNKLIKDGENLALFVNALEIVCLELAKMIVKDAEGSTKFIRIKVKGAKNFEQARKVALNIANSNLFKTAMYGESTNFGRIFQAIGASAIEIEEEKLKVKVSPLKRAEISVEVNINRGKFCATVYTSDLTPEYIRINAEYN